MVAKRTILVRTSVKKYKVREGMQEYKWAMEVLFLQKEHHVKSVEYVLHPDFAPVPPIRNAPYRVKNKGWGGFEVQITIKVLFLCSHRSISLLMMLNKNRLYSFITSIYLNLMAMRFSMTRSTILNSNLR
jgi:transcription initiation factor IIF auxiliary subunit